MDGPPDIENSVALPIQISLNSNQQRNDLPPTPRKSEKHPPQKSVNLFWNKFYSKYPGKVFTILPENPYAQKKIAKASKGVAQAQRAVRSYEQAREECIRDVKRIVRECKRVNQKYRDPHFDLECDLKKGRRYCLEGLDKPDEEYNPKAVKRITDIFEEPKFFIKGPTVGDVIQGQVGDCYVLAGLCSLGSMPGLIKKVCVIRDEAIGVYGFVFHRDGEWQQCIIDDQLYLTAPDYDESNVERKMWDTIARRDTEEEYRRTHQTGSRALYFAKGSDPNETWLPLLEKAYAKAHGDYAAISGGWTGEAVEDLTGGVSSEVYSADILDRDEFWTNQLLKVGKEFIFGCSTGQYADWLEPHRPTTRRQGIFEGHAYSVMDAQEHVVEGKTYRLVKLRNPWGNTGWTGAWSDGSAEWTPQWMERLGHKFGDDGIFWMSYTDLLRKYQRLDRTRIFGEDWKVTQQWTSLHIPWSADYHQTRFSVTVSQTTPVVIVLSQLDKRYFSGLEGQYMFKLQFRVQRVGDDDDYIVRSNVDYYTSRSVSTDITLEAGSYLVLMKITATRYSGVSLDEIISSHADLMREKLIQVGLSYDIAHAKGVIVETEQEQEDRELSEAAKAVAAREKRKAEVKAQLEKRWKKDKKLEQRILKREASAARRAAHYHQGSDLHSKLNPLRTDTFDSVADAGGIVSSDRSFTGEFIASYEHSHGTFSPITELSDAAYESPTTDGNLPTPPSVADDTSDEGPRLKPIHEHPPTPKVQVNGVDAVTDVKPLKRRPAPLTSRPLVDRAQTYPSPGRQVPSQDPQPEPNNNSLDFGTDTDSEFDWQSDLDFDSDSEQATPPPSRNHNHSYPSSSSNFGLDADLEPSSEDPSHPWNAVCVVGLRVYSKDPDLSIEVMRPNPYSSEGKVRSAGSGGVLDRDDPAKGALVEKWARTPLRETFEGGDEGERLFWGQGN